MPRQSRTHYDTLTKVKIQGVHQYLFSHATSFDFRDIFREFDVFERTSYLIIKQPFSCTRHKSDIFETRDQKRKITEAQIDEADRILQDENFQRVQKASEFLTLKLFF